MAKKTNCTKNGKDYYRISTTIGRSSNGKLIRKEFYGSSKKEAEKKRDEYLNNINQGLDIDYNKKQLSESMILWLNEYVKISNKPSTYDRYLGIYNNYIDKSVLSNKVIESIKPMDIQIFYNSLYKSKKTSSTINTINKVLKSFFTFAFNQGYITNNPCIKGKVVIPGDLKSEAKEIEIFSDEDISKILNSKNNVLIKYLSIFSLATGMRRGECLGLQWKDIYDDEVHIERSSKTVALYDENSVKRYKSILQSPKTQKSKRVIPLPNSLKSILKDIRAIQAQNKLLAGSSYIDNDLIFCTEIGKLLDDRNISRSFKRFLKSCDVEYKNFHALRHTYATKQFELGVPLKTVSVLLGHSDIYITANRYTHVLKHHKEQSVDFLKIV